MLASIFSLNVLQTALELGCIYGLVALALFLSYSILNIADPSMRNDPYRGKAAGTTSLRIKAARTKYSGMQASSSSHLGVADSSFFPDQSL